MRFRTTLILVLTFACSCSNKVETRIRAMSDEQLREYVAQHPSGQITAKVKQELGRRATERGPAKGSAAPATSSRVETGTEMYTVPAFDKMIADDPQHPSYSFWLDKGSDKGRGLYVLQLDYPTLPPSDDAVAQMKAMISYVTTNYPPRQILCTVFENGKTAHIVDGDSSLCFDPESGKILTMKQKSGYTKEEVAASDSHAVTLERQKDAFDRDMIRLTFSIKTDLDKNPDAVVNLMLTRLVQEIRKAPGKLGICSARGYDRTGEPIDGASIEFTPDSGRLSRIWYRVHGHDFRTEELGNIRDFK